VKIKKVFSEVSRSEDVQITLQKPDVHRRWEDAYRTTANETFFEQAFDYITGIVAVGKNAVFLDAGCGTGAHSIRLARRGFSVVAVDFSEQILTAAASNITSTGVHNKVNLVRGNLLSLDFADGTFDAVLCWGVLMHVPDVENAMAELGRVLKNGGILVISEANMHSLESIVFRACKRFFARNSETIKRTETGLEYWAQTSAGKLLTRQARIGWLKKRLEQDGFIIRTHVAGQFTELYTRLSSKLLVRCIHAFNFFWFKYAKIPQLAFGNILIAEKVARNTGPDNIR
jgi:ubiquinone/menaquinone biosynthesis C-methylase UbiE